MKKLLIAAALFLLASFSQIAAALTVIEGGRQRLSDHRGIPRPNGSEINI